MRRLKFYVSAIMMVGFLGTATVSCVDDKDTPGMEAYLQGKGEAAKIAANAAGSEAEANKMLAEAAKITATADALVTAAQAKVEEAKVAGEVAKAKMEEAKLAMQLETDKYNKDVLVIELKKAELEHQAAILTQAKVKAETDVLIEKQIGLLAAEKAKIAQQVLADQKALVLAQQALNAQNEATTDAHTKRLGVLQLAYTNALAEHVTAMNNVTQFANELATAELNLTKEEWTQSEKLAVAVAKLTKGIADNKLDQASLAKDIAMWKTVQTDSKSIITSINTKEAELVVAKKAKDAQNAKVTVAKEAATAAEKVVTAKEKIRDDFFGKLEDGFTLDGLKNVLVIQTKKLANLQKQAGDTLVVISN